MRSVPGTAVVTIFISAAKALAEVVAILKQVNIVPVITVGCVLVGVRILVVETPPILSIRLSGAYALFITEVHGPPKHIRAVLIRLVVSTPAIVAIAVRRVRVLALALEAEPVLTQPLKIKLLKPVLVHASLLLKRAFPLRRDALLLLSLSIVFRKPLLVTPLLL